jgi:hypothetical protein
MAHYKADVWLGSNSGMQTVEVNSSSFSGVIEQICSIYNVTSTQIRNVREVSPNAIQDAASDDSAGAFGGLVLLGLGVFVWLFVSYAPYLLMGTFGWGSAWALTKLSGRTTVELLEKKNQRLYQSIFIASLFFGGLGMVWGDKIHQHYSENSTEEPAAKIAK